MSPFLAWGDFHARLRFARSTIPEDKWGTTRSLTPRSSGHIGRKKFAVFAPSKPRSHVRTFILLHEEFLQFYWLRAVVFSLNLKYLHVKITNLLVVVV